MDKFVEKDIHSWDRFAGFIRGGAKRGWLYRGQVLDWPLTSSLERSLSSRNVEFDDAPAIEKRIIRDFRRRYGGSDEALVNNDLLYCLSVMQHHGAPTRLTDWTYSPYVAAKFAAENGLRAQLLNGK
jgi:hypothetical protein